MRYADFSFCSVFPASFKSLITAPILHEPVKDAPGSIDSLFVIISPLSLAEDFKDNNWDTERMTGDGSLAMDTNELIYLSDKGCHKLIKFCKELKNKEKVVAIFIKTLKDFHLEESDMEYIYRKVININEFENLNFYDARAIIKIFGPESGIHHYGKSGTNTIELRENFKIMRDQ